MVIFQLIQSVHAVFFIKNCRFIKKNTLESNKYFIYGIFNAVLINRFI